MHALAQILLHHFLKAIKLRPERGYEIAVKGLLDIAKFAA
jgi:hypothetical protein